VKVASLANRAEDLQVSLALDAPPLIRPGRGFVVIDLPRAIVKRFGDRRWVGGVVPLGYRCIDKKLEIVPEEAEVVRTIFTCYLERGSMGALLTELDRQGIKTKVNGRRDGRRSGGIRFGVGSLAHLLKNRF
jgi:Recombinase